jgi:hypothetical protein
LKLFQVLLSAPWFQKDFPDRVGVAMTLTLITALFAWLALGCIVAWFVGRASDIGGQQDSPVANYSASTWNGRCAEEIELPEFTSQSRQVRIILSRE